MPGEEFNCGNQQSMLHRGKPGGQAVAVVARQHRYANLRNYRSSIKFLGDEMYARAVFLITGIECTLIGIRTPLQRQ